MSRPDESKVPVRLRPVLWAFFLAPACLHAQFHVDWFATSAGGGTQTGGGYLVRGTVGRFGGPAVSGGAYVVAGGFWGIEVFQPLNGPRLEVERILEGLRISWPLSAGDGVLEETDTLDATPIPWRIASYPFTTNGATVFVTIPLTAPPATPTVSNGSVRIPVTKVVKFRRR